jgi:predicted O-linked N-acetylglucosamine transferase (SPINDLY family)
MSAARPVRLSPASPRDASAQWLEQARLLQERHDIAGAEVAVRRAIMLDPCFLAARKFAGALLAGQHRYPEAVAIYRAIPPQAERDHEYHCAYGEALLFLERYPEAIEQFVLSFTCKPDYLWAHVRLANTLSRIRLHQEAVECFRTALMLEPRNAQFLGNLIHQNQQACRWDTLAGDLAALLRMVREDAGNFITPFTLLSLESTPQDQLAAGRVAAERMHGRPQELPPEVRAPRLPGERLRIGYLSADFHQHATAMLITEVLERHDRQRFDVHLYSTGPDDGSPLRRRLMAAGHFIDAARISDPDLARRIRDDGIDILVDLKGFTRDGRLGVLARRPAPIQVTWLGFPGTCGADFVDYLIGDPVVTPLADQPVFSERIAQMPWSYQPNDRQRPLGEPLPRARCGLPAQAFVFCSFNASFKILPPVFERWCRLLRAVPGSVLWLLESNPQAMANLAREAAARGIDPARIVFAPFVPPEQHLPRLMAADLFLDTLPYNAHTTASDALWVGLPVVTCQGETFAARVAASLLRAADCEELVTGSLDAYEALALALARDPDRLAAIRHRLVDGRMRLPLFDSARFARDLESLYLRMTERHRVGLPPAPLPASPSAA